MVSLSLSFLGFFIHCWALCSISAARRHNALSSVDTHNVSGSVPWSCYCATKITRSHYHALPMNWCHWHTVYIRIYVTMTCKSNVNYMWKHGAECLQVIACQMSWLRKHGWISTIDSIYTMKPAECYEHFADDILNVSPFLFPIPFISRFGCSPIHKANLGYHSVSRICCGRVKLLATSINEFIDHTQWLETAKFSLAVSHLIRYICYVSVYIYNEPYANVNEVNNSSYTNNELLRDGSFSM